MSDQPLRETVGSLLAQFDAYDPNEFSASLWATIRDDYERQAGEVVGVVLERVTTTIREMQAQYPHLTIRNPDGDDQLVEELLLRIGETP